MPVAEDVVRRLLSRSLLASFRISPRPASFADSMAVFGRVQSVVSQEGGRIMHYRQGMCPVTKERLDTLDVLLEDQEQMPERITVVNGGEPVAALSALEKSLLSAFKDRISLNELTRDPTEINSKLQI